MNFRSSQNSVPPALPHLTRGGFLQRVVPLLVICFVLGLAAATYAGGYCAIAYSEETGRWGYGDGFESRHGAEHRALEECRAEDAKVVIWRHNGYVALARGEGKLWGAAGGDTRESAERKAREACPSDETRIVQWVYSFD